MNDTDILLNENIDSEKRYISANNIIVNYELPLTVEQILLAHEKVRDWISRKPHKDYIRYNRWLLFNKILNVNKNIYIAIILATCDNFNPSNLSYFMIFFKREVVDIGIDSSCDSIIEYYCKLLDYYEFDVSNLYTNSEESKLKIQNYHFEKYSGKLTKHAIKNE